MRKWLVIGAAAVLVVVGGTMFWPQSGPSRSVSSSEPQPPESRPPQPPVEEGSPDAGTPGPKPMDLLFDLADCHEQQGHSALAASEFEKVAEAGGTNANDARARANKLRGLPPPGEDVPKTQPGTGPDDPQQTPPKQDAVPIDKQPKEVTTASEEPPTRIGDFMDTRLTLPVLRVPGAWAGLASPRTYRQDVTRSLDEPTIAETCE